METPVIVKKTYPFLKFVLSVFLAIVAIGAVYFLYIRITVNESTVKNLIAAAAKNYESPVTVEKILLQGVREITHSPLAFDQAKDYAKATNVPLEQVLVDNAIAMAKNIGYIS